MPVVVVSAAIFDDQGRILCVEQNYGGHHWALPGGGMEGGESPAEALQREVLEETGFFSLIGELIGIYSAPWKDSLVLLFQAETQARREWIPDNEISQLGFFSPGALPSPMNPRMYTRIQDAHDGKVGIVRTFGPEEA